MNEKNNFNSSVIIVLILVFIGGYFLLSKNQNPQQSEIDTLKSEIENLKNEKSQTIVKEIPEKSTSIVDIVSEWGPIIPIVVCNFRDQTGTVLETSEGSAVLMKSSVSGKFSVVTNKHVITNSIGNFANDCEIQFPNDQQIFTILTVDMYFNPNGSDAAVIEIKNPNSNIENLINTSKKKFCLSVPNIGNQIVILGYPVIGASSGITATEGIISGYDGDYYVTSAKVEHGNSGGVAIDVKNNCDLGIPTLVETGNLESLARILKWQVVAPADQIQSALNNKL